MFAPAVGTPRRDAFPVAAEMALQVPGSPPHLEVVRVAAGAAHESAVLHVIGERHRTVRALDGLAASAAGDEIVVSSPVEEQDRLLAPAEALAHPSDKSAAQGGCVPGGKFFFKVGELHLGQRGASESLFQLHQGVFSLLRLVVARQRRRGGREEHHRPVFSAAEPRHVVSQVFRGGLRFVGVLVLLVDNDEPDPWYGRENRRTGADGDIRVSVAETAPGVVSLSGGQAGVDHRHAVSEARHETPHGLRGQGDLRHQHDDSLAVLDHP